MTERRFSAASRVALGAAVKHWHQTKMPRHFTTAAPAMYGYAPRTVPYMRHKARKMKHQRPLTWSGASRDQAKNDVTFNVRKADDYLEGSATMLMPDYFVKHPNKGGRFIDKKDELTRTTAAERQEQIGVFSQRLAQELGRSTIAMTA